MELEFSFADTLVKVAMFVVVQVLVYLVLNNSSDVFSKNKMRSFSFKSARSASIRRILAAISDLPQGGEPSPSSRGSSSPTQQEFPIFDDKDSSDARIL
ncbi:Velvet complex subunit B like [Melia azedarach]|uniref:Velvet complex subunit B like n=1 Tax=Melia azedarach TaxID=155640 RepID=A0ACC1YL53_MELAZ|nr:Velvet complex subunit B like [Melia azedarach]